MAIHKAFTKSLASERSRDITWRVILVEYFKLKYDLQRAAVAASQRQ